MTKICFWLSLVLAIVACGGTEKKDLASVEKAELAKGVRNDSIFQGLYLGMPEPDFYALCWKKNKEKFFSQAQNMKVDYDLVRGECRLPIKINFFPTFLQGKVIDVPMVFKYINADYFNPDMKVEKLLVDVKKLMEKWYGDFFLTPLPTGRNGYAQVKGNRSIVISVEKDNEVKVVFTDLTVVK